MEQNASLSLLPSAGGHIMAMRGGAVMQGGNVPVGFDPTVSVIQLPPSANHIPIVDMKGGDKTLPMAAAVTVVTAPVMKKAAPEEAAPEEAAPEEVITETGAAPITANGSSKTTDITPPKPEATPPRKPIRFILFGEEFNDFSTASTESSTKILALLGEIKEDQKQAVLQQIYDGIIHLRTSDLTTYPHFKRLLTNMCLTYAKQKNELKEEIVRPELTEIQLAFPNDTDVTVTLTIKCDQMPSCSKNNLALAAAATVMIQKGGEDTARTIRLFGKDYFFPTSPNDINGHLDLLKELEVEDKDAAFKLTLLEEIYDGCYTDGSIISKIKCSTFGTLLEELGQKYATKMHELLVSGALPSRLKKKEESASRKELPNGDIELTFTFSNFGKQLDAETQEKISKAVQKSTNAQSFGSKLKHMVSTVSSDQVSIHGMDNQKNACFCISALQFLFSIPQIRTAIKKHGCKSELLAQILTQIHDPHYEMTEVNQDGIMCALFNLFEELGEDMALFSTLTDDFKAGTAVPYELLGYIMKNLEVDSKVNKRDYRVGNQEDVEIFLTFLFGIFDAKKIPIRQMFEFIQKTTIDPVSNVVNQPSQSNEEKESSQTVWKIPNENKHEFKTSYNGERVQRLVKLSTTSQEDTTVIYHTTLELKDNSYLLIRPSVPGGDLSGIHRTLSIDKKQFTLYGIIRKRGTAGGHYIYDRQDLASIKHIVYNDDKVTLVNDAIQMTQNDGLNAYLLIYAEMGQEQKEAHFKEEAQKMEEKIRDKARASIELMTKDINKSGGVDNNVNMHMIDFIQEGYMIGLDTTGQSGGGNKEELWKSRPPVGDLLFFKGAAPTTDAKTEKNLSVADLCLMLKEYAQKTRIRESTKSTSMDILSSEMDKAKELYMKSTDDTDKKNALVAYAIFDILKELMEGIKPIPKEELEAKSTTATAIQKSKAEKIEAREKEGTIAAFKKKHPFLTDAPAKNTTVPTAVAAAAAAMSNESDATSEEVLSAKSETSEEVLPAKSEISEEDRQRQMAANEKRQQENMNGRNGRNIELSSLPNSPLSSNSKLAAKKEQAASLLASMRTLSDEIKELKQDPTQNSNKIRDKIYELTAMRSNVNEIQGINKSNSTNAANILKEAMKPTQPVDSASSNAANVNRNENRPPVIPESEERQASALPSENEYNEYKNNNNVSNKPKEFVELQNFSSNKKSAQSSNLASSASFVNKTRKSGQAVSAALEQERKEKEERKAKYQANREQREAEQREAKQKEAEQREAEQAKKKATPSISDKITDSLRIAQILKDKPINDPAVNKIKTDFGIDASEMDKSKIMDELLDNVGRWMEAIDRQTNDKSDPAYISTYVDYIALLVTKSMIDAQMGDKPIPNESAKSIAQRLIDNYSKMKNPTNLSIEEMAKHMIEKKYYKRLEATSNQSQVASPRLQKQNDTKQSIAKKAIDAIKSNKTIQEYTTQQEKLKSTILTASSNIKKESIKELHQVEMALMKEYVLQMQILKDAIKEIGPENASADLSAELDVILSRLQGVFSDNRDLKRREYKTIAKDELELYKEGEVLREKARYHMGLEEKKPAESSSKEAIKRAKAMSPMLYEGGRRTLRAAKKKRTLRAANKKRTLRASKKLRRSTLTK